tara:strand:+ start:463 stop:855 length:393 start_codon:yes stop_codon:yes gene_type:complete
MEITKVNLIPVRQVSKSEVRETRDAPPNVKDQQNVRNTESTSIKRVEETPPVFDIGYWDLVFSIMNDSSKRSREFIELTKARIRDQLAMRMLKLTPSGQKLMFSQDSKDQETLLNSVTSLGDKSPYVVIK